MITDFHVHAFPDSLAERAMTALLAETENVAAYHDGRLASLLASMDKAGIRRAVLCSIATKPEQFDRIFEWSGKIAGDRIVPLPSVHPDDPRALERLQMIADRGFKGIKLHPYYQEFDLDEPRLTPLFRRLAELNLLCVCHTGFDVAFPRFRRADPARIMTVLARVPELKLVTTHLGSWQDWEAVRRHMLGRPVYMETSYSLNILSRAEARALLLGHPPEYLLFGTDSPWQEQSLALRQFRELALGPGLEQAMLETNAERLLSGAGRHG